MDDDALASRSHVPAGAEAASQSVVTEVADRIVVVRGRRVMLDTDLATLYGVRPKRLNEQVKRNGDRFPPDFMFRLTPEESDR